MNVNDVCEALKELKDRNQKEDYNPEVEELLESLFSQVVLHNRSYNNNGWESSDCSEERWESSGC